jgi:hypothetical protein
MPGGIDRYLLIGSLDARELCSPLELHILAGGQSSFEQSSELLQAYQSLGMPFDAMRDTGIWLSGWRNCHVWDAMDYIAENFTGEGFACG